MTTPGEDLVGQPLVVCADVRGRSDPHAIVATKEALRAAESGACVEVLCDANTSVPTSLSTFCQSRNWPHQLLPGTEKGVLRLIVQKVPGE